MKEAYIVYHVDNWDFHKVVRVASTKSEAIEMVKTDEDIICDIKEDRGSIIICEFEMGKAYSGRRVFETTNDFDRAMIVEDEI